MAEDGRRGVVSFKHEDGDAGPAWLYRDGEGERLFFGRWASHEQARAYAIVYGHEFKSG